MTTISEKQLMERLGRVPLFSQASRSHLRALARAGKILTWPEGKEGVVQGATASAFYLILDGGVVVTRDEKPVARLNQDDFFGEAAMISGKPRNAAVTATTGTTLFALSRFAFRGAIKANPELAMKVMAALAERQAPI
ncbi:MAG: cyclic nucleotide-binding domain-containing protein [Acidimicrobiales bacterium]|nr:cyclic nucleotide-binding domain-containing protein [Acidimicrobiales bacterium]RZV48611.1 MAG: cyclic nucleotide-binding domain-containing protein [Acidimicrobiales bacterium]